MSLKAAVAVLWLAFSALVRRLFKLANLIFDLDNFQFEFCLVTDWKKMEVKFNRSCSGDVFLYSKEERKSPVSANGWREDEGRRLCSDLQCGNFVSVRKRNSTDTVWNSNIRCRGVNNTGSIWDCDNKVVATVTEQKEQLVIECEGKNNTKFICESSNVQFSVYG